MTTDDDTPQLDPFPDAGRRKDKSGIVPIGDPPTLAERRAAAVEEWRQRYREISLAPINPYPRWEIPASMLNGPDRRVTIDGTDYVIDHKTTEETL